MSKNILIECFNSMVGTTAEIYDDSWIDYFVDPLDDKNKTVLHKIMLPNHSLVIGRRGTGKSCLLSRAYIECLSSLKDKVKKKNLMFTKGKRILPVYINLKEIWDPTAIFGDKAPYIRKIIFMSYFLSKVWISLNSEGIDKLLNWRNKLSNKTSKKIKSLIQKITNPEFVPTSTGVTIIKEIETDTKNRGFELNITSPSIKRSSILSTTKNKSTIVESTIISSISEIMNELVNLLKDYKIDMAYIFLDEFSEIPDEQQQFLEKNLLSTHFIPQDSIFKAKLAVYPGQYKFISLDESRELNAIKLDFVELYGDFGKGLSSSYKNASNKAIEFTKSLIEKRLNHYQLDIEFKDLFEKPDDALEYLLLTSMNIPRNIGHILQNCAEKRDIPFKMSDIKGASIEYIEKCQSRDFIRKISNIYGGRVEEHTASYIKLISKVRFQNEGKKRSEWVPQSHFWVGSLITEYMSVLEGAFLVLRIGLITPKKQELAKYGGISKKFDVYVLNRAICDRENFMFELDSEKIRGNRFDYSDIFFPYELVCENNHVITGDDIMEFKGVRYCGKCFTETDKRTKVIERKIEFSHLEDRSDIDQDVLKEVKKNVKQTMSLISKFEKIKELNVILSEPEKELIEILTYESKLRNKDIGLKLTEIMNYSKVRYLIERLNNRCISNNLPPVIISDKYGKKTLNPNFNKILET
ncbi:hypothetical protein LCGC14_1039120 [marine sediment metagenome]|uniref:Uncharacterized protein n=1 Tax=marine sediment metagenome TaxID=412755 RepID=A0A0F9QAJ1_9ZZZZ